MRSIRSSLTSVGRIGRFDVRQKPQFGLSRAPASRRMRGVSQQPDPTPEEQDAPLERREDEEAMRYPGHEDPEETIEPDPDAP
jgi:hypothetical protein